MSDTPTMTLSEALAVMNFVSFRRASGQHLNKEQELAWEFALPILNQHFLEIWKRFEQAEKE